MKNKITVITASFTATLMLLALVQFLLIKYHGYNVPVPVVPRTVQQLGSTGSAIKYAVMGDSTSIGQGAYYKQSYAYASAAHLARNHQVSLLNVGISGAVTKDLLGPQLTKVEDYKPDIVLLAVGANDVTAFTSGSSVEKSLQSIVDGIKTNNPSVKIIVTGCPAMDAVPRFPAFGARQLAGIRERQINKVYSRIIAKNHLTLAPIALKTGPRFAADPTLFAADKFHPDARGYVLWTTVINNVLDSIVGAI